MAQAKDYAASYKAIENNPKYQALVSSRARFATLLTAIVLTTYYAFMLVVAFAPSWLGAPIGEGGSISVGWPIGAGLVIGYWILTGIYVRRANNEFESLSQALVKEVSQ